MNAEPTNRELAAAARMAADVIQARGKATGEYIDDQGRVCALGALGVARDELGYDISSLPFLIEERAASALQFNLVAWNDLPTTTAADIAKVFLQVADEIEVAP